MSTRPAPDAQTRAGDELQASIVTRSDHAAALRASEARYRMLVESAHDGIVVCDGADRVVLANPAFAAMCGRPLEVLIGMPLVDLLDPDELAREPLPHAALGARSRLEARRTLRRPDGTRVPVEVGVTRLDDGQVQCVVHDVTERQRIEEQLRASEQRFRGIFDGTFQFVGLLSTQGVLLEANRAALDFVGASAAEVRGELFWETPWWNHAADAQRQLEEAVARAAAGEFVRFEAEHQSPDGRTIAVDFSLQPVTEPDGRITFLIAEGRDVTEARHVAVQLRQSEETFRSAFEHSGIGMALVGLDGRFLRVNRALCQIVGYDEMELLARSFQDITHAEDLPADLARRRELLSGARDSYGLEKRYVRKDGRLVWVLVHGAVVRDEAGAARLFVVQVQDVTERKRAEDALARQHLELARSNAELEQFAYVASHDLQEPLRAIASYTQLLADRYAPQLDDRARRYIRYAVQGAERMRALIEDVLALSRVGSDAQAFEPVALDAVLDDALQRLAQAIRESQATITRAPLPTVRGDAAQLGQLLQNLVANAIKFRRPDAAPHVHVSASAGAGEWTVSVRDDGIGMDARFHDRVFAVFKRLHTQSEYPGTGMGLAICKKVVERHGGRIWAESVPNEGSTFHFTIPA